MATTIDAGFNEFLNTLRTTPAETAAAASHRASIEAKLKESFGITSFFRTGSFGNGTNISGYSDVDYFAVIPIANLKQDSAISLNQVANVLRERFPLTDGIRVDTPGVRIPFGLDGAGATEIVPVDHLAGLTQLGYDKFDIPDGAGGWKFSAPDSHNAYVHSIDESLNKKLKPLVRFVKAWKFFRNAPIKSFYLEIRAAKYADSEKCIIYDIDIKRFLKLLLDQQLVDVQDPRFPNDPLILKACNTDLQREDALAKLRNAYLWAARAVDLRTTNARAAFEQWNLVFNHQFPAYTSY